MALRIVTSDDPIKVEQIIMVIYAAPGVGKTTLGFSSESPLALDFDKGVQRSMGRKDSVPIDTWGDVSGMNEQDLKPYKTIIVDTVGRCLDVLSMDIIKRNPKLGYSGNLTLQGYGVLKGEFQGWLKMLRSMGKDVVLIAHSSEEKKGDDIIERLDVQGGSKGEIYKCADAMGKLTIVGNNRILNFSPTETSFGKNPAQLPQIIVPEIDTEPAFLSGIIENIKNKLNAMTEAQEQRQKDIADWLAKFDEAVNADDYNKLVSEVKGSPKEIQAVIKGALHKIATAAGMTYDKERGYVEAKK